jgi:hypothetical protein
MRELQKQEINHVSGGIDIAFFYGALRGAESADYASTIGHCALFGAALAGILSSTSVIPAVGLVAVPCGAFIEMVMGSIGYVLGSMAANPPAHTVVIR